MPFAEDEYLIGLDGVPRPGTGDFGMPASSNGNWEGENVFIVEIDEIGNLLNWRLELDFRDDKVTATISGNFPKVFVIQGKRARSP